MKRIAKQVTEEEFWKFIKSYPNKLEQDQYPEYMHTFNDFLSGKVWPESVVCWTEQHGEEKREFYIYE